MLIEDEIIKKMHYYNMQYMKMLENKDSIIYLERKRNAVRNTIENIEFI